MPSPDNLGLPAFEEAPQRRFPIRSTVEWFLRGVSLATLVFLLWLALHALHRQAPAWASGKDVRKSLVLWSTRESPPHAHIVFDSVPTPDLRDWVAALPGAGTKTTWEGASLKPSAVDVEPVADPKQLKRVWVAAPGGSSVIVGDTLSEIDSVKTMHGGAVLVVPHLVGTIHATVGGTTASTVLRDSVAVKPILILGIASWEGKFIMASLEEYGWHVDARFSVGSRGPVGVVVQGDTVVQIDTAHYSAVIALDTAAVKYAGQIDAFVRQGGGFIAAGDAATLPAFASLLPATPSGHLEDADILSDTLHPTNTFGTATLSQAKQGAVGIESRNKQMTVVARRIGTGRVLQVGYDNTWRWRMGGVGDPVTKYQSWWSAMVSSVAYAPRTQRAVAAAVEPTPLASLVSILGSPTTEAAPKPNPLDDPRLIPALFSLLMGALFLEWASRRLRGRA